MTPNLLSQGRREYLHVCIIANQLREHAFSRLLSFRKPSIPCGIYTPMPRFVLRTFPTSMKPKFLQISMDITGQDGLPEVSYILFGIHRF